VELSVKVGEAVSKGFVGTIELDGSSTEPEESCCADGRTRRSIRMKRKQWCTDTESTMVYR